MLDRTVHCMFMVHWFFTVHWMFMVHWFFMVHWMFMAHWFFRCETLLTASCIAVFVSFFSETLEKPRSEGGRCAQSQGTANRQHIWPVRGRQEEAGSRATPSCPGPESSWWHAWGGFCEWCTVFRVTYCCEAFVTAQWSECFLHVF